MNGTPNKTLTWIHIREILCFYVCIIIVSIDLAEDEYNDPKHGREAQVLRNEYFFETGTNMPRHPCLDTPVDLRDVERNASLGYCTIHRHPLFVEFIESLSELLISVLRRSEAVDLAAALAACQNDPLLLADAIINRGGPSWIEDIYRRYLFNPFDLLTSGRSWDESEDDRPGYIVRANIVCQGSVLIFQLCLPFRLPT